MGLDSNLSCARSLALTSSGVVGEGSYLTHCILTLMGLDSNLSCARSLAPTSSGVVGGGKLPDSLGTHPDEVGLESLLCEESGSDLLWGCGGREVT